MIRDILRTCQITFNVLSICEIDIQWESEISTYGEKCLIVYELSLQNVIAEEKIIFIPLYHSVIKLICHSLCYYVYTIHTVKLF